MKTLELNGKMVCFRDVFKFPLHYDGMNYIWDADNGMVLMFGIDDDNSEELRFAVVKALNGENVPLTIPDLTYKETEYFIGDKLFMIQRGWGNLTSPSCLGLSDEGAMRLQDEFAEYVIQTLNPPLININ